MKKEYRVVFEIEVFSEGPVEAVKEVQNWLRDENTGFMFYVQDTETEEKFIVDLDANPPELSTLENYTPLIE